MIRQIGGLVLGGGLIACVGVVATPPPNTELEAVRSIYESAAKAPQIRQYAPSELGEATAALRRADSAWRAKAPDEDVTLLAYRVRRLVRMARWAAGQKASGAELPSVLSAEPKLAGGSPDSERMFADLEARCLDVRRSARGPVVTLDRGLFAEGSELKPIAREMLDRLAQFLAEHPDRAAVVEGYTDDMGSIEYNERVSRERAESVSHYLQSRSVSAARLSATGYGVIRPLVANSSTSGRHLNRRVEIVIESAADHPPAN
jgi:outer membrane protein OmpA-like peptidoglycan-associated protein